MMNMQNLMKQAQGLQKKFTDAQDAVALIEVTGCSGGGMVEVTINGKGEFRKIHIDPSLLNPDEKEMLEDLIAAAFKNAKQSAENAANEYMTKAGISPDLMKMMPL